MQNLKQINRYAQGLNHVVKC